MEREDAQLSATETIREAQAWSANSQRLFEIFDELRGRSPTRRLTRP